MAPRLLFHRSHEFVARSAGLPELHQRVIFLKPIPQRQPEDTFQVPGQQDQDQVQRLVVEIFFQGIAEKQLLDYQGFFPLTDLDKPSWMKLSL